MIPWSALLKFSCWREFNVVMDSEYRCFAKNMLKHLLSMYCGFVRDFSAHESIEHEAKLASGVTSTGNCGVLPRRPIIA